jgi:carboxylate-amine ligase
MGVEDVVPATVGVEEEMFVVDAETLELRPDGAKVIESATHHDADTIDAELSRSQVETGSAVCSSLDDLATSLTWLRRRLDRSARAHGARLLPSGTHPVSSWRDAGGIIDAAAYLKLAEDYGRLTDEQVVSGCHVHVGIHDPEMAIQVMNRVRLDAPILLALGVNSPYWEGEDTGYASYRTELFHRWPTTGMPEWFASRADYDELLATMTAVEAIDAPARIYWDIRPSARYPTLELRVADVQPTVEEAVVLAGLFRALVLEAADEVAAHRPPPPVRSELLRAAVWRAARFGLEDRLLDLRSLELVDARTLVDRTVERVGAHLERTGDRERIEAGIERLHEGGTGAARQRAARARRGDPLDVCRELIDGAVPPVR